MLQQTSVSRVGVRWDEFIDRFPSPTHLANSSLVDVLALWQGLGYPRRARHLHLAAKQIVGQHNGEVPNQLESLLALPGVGPYTARAVLSFGFNERCGIVDTNVGRVLARTSGSRLTPSAAQRLADDLVRAGRSAEINQALIDVGAMFCRAQPQCASCPLRSACSWRAGDTDDPATRSAGVSRAQHPFRGSLRELRGQVLRTLTQSTQRQRDLVRQFGERTEDATASLERDGLIVRDGEWLSVSN